MSKFMITLRSVSGGAFGGALGAIRYLIVPDGVDPTPDQAVTRTDWIKQIMQTFPLDRQGNATGNLLFFVHGFNELIADVAKRHGDLAAGLAGKLDCTVVSFDWPSQGRTFAYLPDLDIAKKTAIELVNAAIRPLIAAQKDNCRVAVHVACHSMGAYVAREAFDHADDGTVTGSDWSVNQLVLFAGDVEASDFVEGDKNTESILGHCYRLTNYFNKYDEVLQISNVKRVGVEPRAGRVGLPPNAPSKTVDIDCSNRFAKIRPAGMNPVEAAEFSHGWYFGDPVFHADLAQTLSGAVDRTVVAGRTLDADGRTLSLPA